MRPEVLVAVDPALGHYLARAPTRSCAPRILGSVFLALTGGEACTRIWGHFGAKPVRIAWFFLVLPALLLNYYGQGRAPSPPINSSSIRCTCWCPLRWLPFMLIPRHGRHRHRLAGGHLGCVFLLPARRCSLTCCRGLRVLQTSAQRLGQIYVPVVNGLLAIAVMAFVVGFGSSDALANALWRCGRRHHDRHYRARRVRRDEAVGWPRWTVVALFGVLLAMDCIFMAQSHEDTDHGGWIPLTLGAMLFGVFSVWRNGRTHLRAALARMAIYRARRCRSFLKDVYRVPGTGVFLASDAGHHGPSALVRNLEHNHVRA